MTAERWARGLRPGFTTARCRPRHGAQGCGAPMVFVTTATGEQIPLDPRPHRLGNVEVFHDPDSDATLAVVHHVIAPTKPWLEPRFFMTHFATCPHAPEHRRKKFAGPSDPKRRDSNSAEGTTT